MFRVVASTALRNSSRVSATVASRSSSRFSNRCIAPIAARSFSSSDAAVTDTFIPGVGKGKTSTGFVGLPVDPDAISNIISKNQALLDKLRASEIPPDCRYAKILESVCNYRIKICQEFPDDPDKVEDEIRAGQVEELVVQAEDEMVVLDMYIKERVWELINPDVKIEIDPVRDFSNDESAEVMDGVDAKK